jgi:hypothetical protein
MAPQQKRALIALGIGVVWFPAWITLAVSKGSGFTGFFQERLWRDDLAFDIVFVLGLVSLIAVELVFRGRRGPARVTMDERDTAIIKRAKVVAAFVTFLTVLLTWLVPWTIYAGRGDDSVPIDLLPIIGLSQAIVFFTTEAVTTLVLYSRKGSHAEG